MLLITKKDFIAQMATSQDKDVIRNLLSFFNHLVKDGEIITGRAFLQRIEEHCEASNMQAYLSDLRYSLSILKSFSDVPTDELELPGELQLWIEEKQKEFKSNKCKHCGK